MYNEPHLSRAMAKDIILPNKFVCLNVISVADGRTHNDRSVALVIVVDQDEEVKINKTIKQEKEVVSYITPLTGLRKGDLDHGEKLEDVIEEVQKLLGPDVVLVGQRITESDIDRMKLKKGIHYQEIVDLGEMFKTYNTRFKDHNYYSLNHEANNLLEPGTILKSTYVHSHKWHVNKVVTMLWKGGQNIVTVVTTLLQPC